MADTESGGPLGYWVIPGRLAELEGKLRDIGPEMKPNQFCEELPAQPGTRPAVWRVNPTAELRLRKLLDFVTFDDKR